jgi:hypothetical protein
MYSVLQHRSHGYSSLSVTSQHFLSLASTLAISGLYQKDKRALPQHPQKRNFVTFFGFQ